MFDLSEMRLPIVAGETEDAVDKALKRIKVQYRVEAPVLDMHKAKDNPILVHPEEDLETKIRWWRTIREICVQLHWKSMEMWTRCSANANTQ